MDRPCIFVSAVSEELKTARMAVAATLRTMAFDSVTEDDFATGDGELKDWLRRQIDKCVGLIQIVGWAYGTKLPDSDPEFGQVSYTQYEYLYAKGVKKKTWIIVVDISFPRDKNVNDLDLPRRPEHIEPAKYQAERRQWQQEYYDRLVMENHLRHEIADKKDLELIVRRLRDDLEELRRSWKRQQYRLAIAIFCGLLLLGVGGWFASEKIIVSVEHSGEVTLEKIGANLQKTSEETRRKDIIEADKAKSPIERQRLRQVADADYNVRMKQNKDLTASFAENQDNGLGTEVFHEMTKILSGSGGVDEAITYVASKRASILETVEKHRLAVIDRNRTLLQPLLKAAALYENKGQFEQVRTLYADIFKCDPNWVEGLNAGFQFFVNLGNAESVRLTKDDARREFEEANGLALRLTSAEPRNAEWQRDLSISYNKLGDVSMDQGDLDEAFKNYQNGFDIVKKLADSDSNNADWQRDLSVSYNKIGNINVAREDWNGAANNYGKGMEIARSLTDKDLSNVDWQRDLSLAFNRLGNVAVARKNLKEAVEFYEKGMAIAKKLAELDSTNAVWQRDLWVSYNKLGNTAVARGILKDAADAYANGKEVANKLTERHPDKPEWKSDLSISFERLGDIALAQGNLEEAAATFQKCMAARKKLVEDDESNTGGQRDLSISYNKLGDVYVAQNNLQEAAKFYEMGIGIAKRLVGSDLSNLEWQRNLAHLYFQFSKLRFKEANWRDAKANAYESLRIYMRLSQKGLSNASGQNDMKEVQALVDKLKEIAKTD